MSARRGSLDSSETSFVRSLPPTPRRNASASKGLAKMPWERDSLQEIQSSDNIRLSESQIFRLPPSDSGGRFETRLPVSARQPLTAWDDQPLPTLSKSIAVGTADRGGSGILFPELSRSVDVERHGSTGSPIIHHHEPGPGDEDIVSKEEMDNSLRQIRNSATKKQLSKIFERGASLEQLQTPPTSINPEIADEWQNTHAKVVKTNGVSKSKLPRRNSNSSVQSNGSQTVNNNNNNNYAQVEDDLYRSQPNATKAAEKHRKLNDGRNGEMDESPVSVVGRSVQMDQTMGNGVYINRQAPPTSRLNSVESLKTGSLARQPPPVVRAPSDRSLHRAKVTQRRINSSSTAESGFEDSDTGDEDQFSRQSSMDSPIGGGRQKSPPKRASAELILPRVSSTASTSDTENPENLRPFKDPIGKLNEAMKQIAVEEWESKCEGLSTLRRLAVHHESILCAQLHTVTLAVAAEVKNLRSQVSRSAMVCLGDMYAYLRRHMDGDLELTISVLLAKSGESNKFIREDAEKSLISMVENVTPIRAMNALITVGASHRNVAIRNITGQLLVSVIEIMTPNRVLREVPDKLLPIAARFLLDGSPETRYNGQKIFYLLMTSLPDELERALNKHLEATTLRNIQDKLDNLRKKGLGDPPAGSHSSRMRRVPSNSQRTRITSAESTDLSQPATMAVNSPAGSRARPLRVDDATLADLQLIESKLGSSDWSERLGGVEQLTKFVNLKPDVVRAQITKVFGKFIPCLHDPNSKVNLAALSGMVRMTPVLAGSLSSVLGHTIQTVAGNLASKNPDINDAASAVLDTLMENIDPTLLLQPFISEAHRSKGQVKVDLTERISYLAMQVCETKPSHATTIVLPFVWHLLSAVINSGGAAPRLRHATANLVTMLYQFLGNDLLAASCNSSVTPPMHDLLNDILDTASS